MRSQNKDRAYALISFAFKLRYDKNCTSSLLSECSKDYRDGII